MGGEVSVQEKEEAELIQRCREGDPAAWCSLLRLHHRALYSVAYRITLNAEEAEDALQDTWVRVAKSLSRFDHRSSFRTWATRILIRQAITRVKSRRVYVTMEDAERIPAPHDAHGSRYTRAEELDVQNALATLSPEERAAVILHYVEGYTFREIAGSLGVPLRTAADYAYRGLRHLRQRLTTENP